MFDLLYIINIATEISFSYFFKRAAIRFFFKFPKFVLLALCFTLILAIIYFFIAPTEPQQMPPQQPPMQQFPPQ